MPAPSHALAFRSIDRLRRPAALCALLALSLTGGARAEGARPAGQFSKPAIPAVPYQALDARREGLHLQLNFPEAARAGLQRETYWMSGPEDLVVDVQLGAGSDVGFPFEVTGTLLFDGAQLPVSIDGGAPQAAFTRSLQQKGAVDRFTFKVPGARIARGGHSATVLFWRRRDGREFPSVAFAIMKDDTRFAPRPESRLFTRKAAERTAGPAAIALPASVLLRGQRLPVERGRLPLRLVMQRFDRGPPDRPLRVCFVAFLDGRQTSLGPLGRRPCVRLAMDERAETEVVLPVSVGRGQAPALALFALPGEGEAREEGGVPTPAALPPRSLGWAVLTR
jgi:hypothetical protein